MVPYGYFRVTTSTSTYLQCDDQPTSKVRPDFQNVSTIWAAVQNGAPPRLYRKYHLLPLGDGCQAPSLNFQAFFQWMLIFNFTKTLNSKPSEAIEIIELVRTRGTFFPLGDVVEEWVEIKLIKSCIIMHVVNDTIQWCNSLWKMCKSNSLFIYVFY